MKAKSVDVKYLGIPNICFSLTDKNDKRGRKYSFFPSNSTVFEEDCLRDIAMFVQHKTQEHKLKK